MLDKEILDCYPRGVKFPQKSPRGRWVDGICGVEGMRGLRIEANGKVSGRPLSSIGCERAACDDGIHNHDYMLLTRNSVITARYNTAVHTCY